MLGLDSFRKRMGVGTAANFQSIPKECIFCFYQIINGEKSHTEVFGNKIEYVFLLQLMEITWLDGHYLKMYYLEFGFLKIHVKSKELGCIYKWGPSHVRAGRRKSHYRETFQQELLQIDHIWYTKWGIWQQQQQKVKCYEEIGRWVLLLYTILLRLLLEDCVKFCLHTSENVKILGRIEIRDSKLIKQPGKKVLRHEC